MTNFQHQSDEELIALYHHGNEAVMDFLMAKYKGFVIQKARTMFLFGGDQEDLIQEGMIGLMKAVRGFDLTRGASFRTYADLSVTRQMYSAIEAANRKKHMPLNTYVSLYDEGGYDGIDTHTPLIETVESVLETNPEEIYIGRQNIENFVRTLESNLSPFECEVLDLHLQGYDYQRIAQKLEKTPKAVDNALQRCKNKAQKLR